MTNGLPLDPDPSAILAAILERDSGVEFGEEARAGFERKLARTREQGGFAAFRDHVQHLASLPSGHAELALALDLLTIKETYFLREGQQVEAYIEEAKRGAELAAKIAMPATAAYLGPGSSMSAGLQKLTIWCAGCSTGEEAYSIAILIAESRTIDLARVRIFATDISKRCVETARKGVYGPSSFRAIPKDIKNRYFMTSVDGELVRENVRATTKFACANILDPARVIGQVDAIFCRNVLIYFSQSARQEAIRIFYDHLVPGGILCLGHSESLLNVDSPFEAVSTSAGILYRRPRGTPPPPHAEPGSKGRGRRGP
jgi:chemotaxis protein methyltransferase CheR